jgi:hypothetical protein
MERQTKQVTLPVTKQMVEIKEWITGRESEMIFSATAKHYKMKPDSYGAGAPSEIDGTIVLEMYHKYIEAYVISIDKKTENLLDIALDLPSADYDFLIKEIDSLHQKKI